MAKIATIIEQHYGDMPDSGPTDLLADIRHYCDAKGLGFHELDREAHGHYVAEIDTELQSIEHEED